MCLRRFGGVLCYVETADGVPFDKADSVVQVSNYARVMKVYQRVEHLRKTRDFSSGSAWTELASNPKFVARQQRGRLGMAHNV